MELDRNARWLGSVSHDNCVKLTDVKDLFEDSDEEVEEDTDKDEIEVDGEAKVEDDDEDLDEAAEEAEGDEEMSVDSDDQAEVKQKKRRGKPTGVGDLGKSSRQNQPNGFFDDL